MQEAVNNFTRITRYDLSKLLIGSELFFSTQQQLIIDYYTGTSEKIDGSAITLLSFLQTQYEIVTQLYRQHKDRFKTYMDWELIDIIEEFKTKLTTVANLGKFLRSNKQRIGFSKGNTRQVVIQPDSTIEEQLRKQYSPRDFDNLWSKIAIESDLREGEYGPDADPITVNFPSTPQRSRPVMSVLNYAIGEELYGRDLMAKLTFDPDTSDLVALEPRATQAQALQILMGLRKGQIPQYPTLGIEQIVGMNKGTVSFKLPIIMRQIRDLFASDDTFTKVQINKIEVVNDAVEIELSVDTVYNTQLNPTMNF